MKIVNDAEADGLLQPPYRTDGLEPRSRLSRAARSPHCNQQSRHGSGEPCYGRCKHDPALSVACWSLVCCRLRLGAADPASPAAAPPVKPRSWC